MRVDQINTSTSAGWCYLTAVFACSDPERVQSVSQLAVPQSPGRAKRIHPYPSSRRYKRR